LDIKYQKYEYFTALAEFQYSFANQKKMKEFQRESMLHFLNKEYHNLELY
jgi:hypothetical protein